MRDRGWLNWPESGRFSVGRPTTQGRLDAEADTPNATKVRQSGNLGSPKGA